MIDVRRVWVDRGFFIDSIDLGGATGHSASWPEPYQVFTPEGEPATGSYRGQGAIVVRDGVRWLFLGDPYRTTTIHEYRIADRPTLTDEQIRDREEYRAGFAAGEDPRRKRMKRDATYYWREGWNDGRRAREEAA